MRGLVLLALVLPLDASAFMGLDLGPLLQLVAGQVQEIQKLTETVGVAKNQQQFLNDLNEGVQRTVDQIQSIQAIVTRAQGLDPREINSLGDLNDLLAQAKDSQAQIEHLLGAKVTLTNQAIASSALQSDTSYKMGQEMVSVGSTLSQESRSASPGRAAQIAAAAESAQMLSQGVELQTLAQILQVQTLSLDFQKNQIEQDLRVAQARRSLFAGELSRGSRKALR